MREVNETQPFSDKLVKLIPTEIVGAYMVLTGVIGFNPMSSSLPADKMAINVIQVVFFILLILTPIYSWKINEVKNKVQIVITTVSFVVWVYSLGGPFLVWNIYYPMIASVILVLWSLVTPLVINVKSNPV